VFLPLPDIYATIKQDVNKGFQIHMIIKTVHDDHINPEGSSLPLLPMPIELESKRVLKKLQEASRALAELKGVALTMPNQDILINTLSLQEAKDSSAIENIITTHDELYRSNHKLGHYASISAKEVHCYASALRNGFNTVKTHQLLTNNHIQAIQAELEGNNAGFRTQAGTVLKNDQTGEVIYTPPQHPQEIHRYMQNLEAFINENDLSDWDPLIKMAMIHHQFESIHPFFDGNGRTGRIINILYLVKEGLLDTPILYLSRYINQNKADYYRLLQEARELDSWEEWVLYMLEGVKQTSYQTIQLIHGIRELMQAHKTKIRNELPNVYSHELLNHLFSHPYTKRVYVEEVLSVHRNTANKYLKQLLELKMLSIYPMGTEKLYINNDLYHLLHNVGAKTIAETLEL
jgi:Fic family protein